MSAAPSIGSAGCHTPYQPSAEDLQRLEVKIVFSQGSSDERSITVREVAVKLNDVMTKAVAKHISEGSRICVSYLADGVVVSGFGRRARMTTDCYFCSSKSSAPTMYELRNEKTEEKIALIEHKWHDITQHGYFGSNFDPKQLCKVLGLV